MATFQPSNFAAIDTFNDWVTPSNSQDTDQDTFSSLTVKDNITDLPVQGSYNFFIWYDWKTTLADITTNPELRICAKAQFTASVANYDTLFAAIRLSLNVLYRTDGKNHLTDGTAGPVFVTPEDNIAPVSVAPLIFRGLDFVTSGQDTGSPVFCSLPLVTQFPSMTTAQDVVAAIEFHVEYFESNSPHQFSGGTFLTKMFEVWLETNESVARPQMWWAAH